MLRVRLGWTSASLVLAAALCQLGCEEKTNKPITAKADAAALSDQAATLDPKVRAALNGGSSPTAPAASKDGPPAGGIFAPGIADTIQGRNSAATIKLGAAGSEPRITLAAQSNVRLTPTLTVSTRTGPRSALPAIDFALTISAQKGDKDAPTILIAKVQKAVASHQQLGELPDGVQKEIAKLKDSEFKFIVSPSGAISDASITPGKGVLPELGRTLAGAAECLITFDVPLPDKPVGAGATWIAQTRMNFEGVDLISYRLYSVKAIAGDEVTIAVQLRQYSASSNADLALNGLPKGTPLLQFESNGEAELTLHKGDAWAKKGHFNQHLGMGFAADGQQQAPAAGQQARMIPVMFETEAHFDR